MLLFFLLQRLHLGECSDLCSTSLLDQPFRTSGKHYHLHCGVQREKQTTRRYYIVNFLPDELHFIPRHSTDDYFCTSRFVITFGELLLCPGDSDFHLRHR